MLRQALISVALLPFTIVLIGCNSNGNNNTNSAIQPSEWLNERVLDIGDEEDLLPLIEAMEGAELVLLGEASHGTHEYYYWRDQICRALIREDNLDFIVVEGDWATIFELNKYVKHMDDAGESAASVQSTFDRWPEWMWANEEVEELAEWLREHNSNLPAGERVGIYGMDVYGHWNAMDVVEEYIETFLPGSHENVIDAYQCLRNFEPDEWDYARSYARGQAHCEAGVKEVVEILHENRGRLKSADQNAWLHAWGAANVVMNAEDYYRSATINQSEGWNSRATHFYEAVQLLRDFYGPESRGAAWAHNTHVGDARATQMAREGRVNIGQLAREDLGADNVFITGFSTYKGKVKAGTEWGRPGQIMEVPESPENSIEHIFAETNREQFLWLIDDEARNFEPLNEMTGHRAIGVTYNPAIEHRGNYVPTIVPERYDAMIFFRETREINSH